MLLVDDESAITDQLAPFLSRAGLQVVTASDGVEGLHTVESQHPDLVALDVMMPRLDGRAMMRQMLDQGHNTPVVLLARIRAVPCRAEAGRPSVGPATKLAADGLVLDRISRRVYLEQVLDDVADYLTSAQTSIEANGTRIRSAPMSATKTCRSIGRRPYGACCMSEA